MNKDPRQSRPPPPPGVDQVIAVFRQSLGAGRLLPDLLQRWESTDEFLD
jgi:hypothetical protein